MTTKKSQEISKIFLCQDCHYSTYKNSEYKKHLLTNKHINTTKYNTLGILLKKEYICDCGKEYNHRASLFNHKKKCKPASISGASIGGASISGANISGASISGASISVANSTDASNNIIELLLNENKDFKNMILELVKTNNELQKQMVDVCQKIQPGNNTTINSHNNNKTFNLQLFLNEECKDAMNMSEFINSIQLKLSDLENIGTLGYTEGMSKIILNEMSGIDQNKRPVHCTDIKRDTLYVKEEDKWEKEQPEYPKLKQAIRKVEQKNFGLMGEWQAEHPDYKDSTTHENTEFLKLVSQTMSGTPENMHKVIKRIAKEVVIDK